LPLLVLPVTVSLLVALLSLWFMWPGKRQPAIACLLFSILLLWASSLPFVAGELMRGLEAKYPPVAVADLPNSDCAVVLGGSLGVGLHPGVDIEMMDAIDRVYQTARLFRAGKTRTIIVAAGNQPWARDLVPEAEQIRGLLVEWGVNPSSIILDTASRNTRENAVNAVPLLRQSGCHSILLVTSAWHMPRAVAAFAKVGVTVTAVAVDVRFVERSGTELFDFIPTADALALTSQALHEWMGIWVYRWRGWI